MFARKQGCRFLEVFFFKLRNIHSFVSMSNKIYSSLVLVKIRFYIIFIISESHQQQIQIYIIREWCFKELCHLAIERK